MKGFGSLLLLPPSLLLLVNRTIVHANELSWAELQPEHKVLAKREWAAEEKLRRQTPVAVKKMTGDEGEKFFLHYWGFEERLAQDEYQYTNSSMRPCLLRGVAQHSEHPGLSIMPFNFHLFKRDFRCPGNTFSCSSSINADICCLPDQTCVSTDDGPGCCPSGEVCGDSIGDCTDGYTSCNGGCCIPGAVCNGVGCVLYGTQTVTTTLTSGARSRTVTGSGGGSGQTRTVTVIQPTTVTISPSGKTTTKTRAVSSNRATSTTTQVSPDPPVLPTSVSASSNGNCLPGYYMCSAHLLGGCCKVGRDCDTTSCPPTGTTITVGGGVTIVQSGPTNVRAQCTSGMFSCTNGGCCPSGYRCEIESCIAGRNGVANVAKVTPSSANVVHWAEGALVLAIIAGLGMILL